MPVWLRCKNCGAKYYTAKSSSKIDSEIICDKCGSSLIIEKKKAENKSSERKNTYFSSRNE